MANPFEITPEDWHAASVSHKPPVASIDVLREAHWRVEREQIKEFSIAYDTAIDHAFHSGFAYLRVKDGRIVECGSALEMRHNG